MKRSLRVTSTKGTFDKYYLRKLAEFVLDEIEHNAEFQKAWEEHCAQKKLETANV